MAHKIMQILTAELTRIHKKKFIKYIIFRHIFSLSLIFWNIRDATGKYRFHLLISRNDKIVSSNVVFPINICMSECIEKKIQGMYW